MLGSTDYLLLRSEKLRAQRSLYALVLFGHHARTADAIAGAFSSASG